MNNGRLFVIDKQTDEEYIAKCLEEDKRLNTAIDKHIKWAAKQFDDAVSKVLIEHGYGKQLDKALHGKTKTMRTRNINIIKGLVEIEYIPGVIKQINKTTYEGFGTYNLKWMGKDAKK